LILRSDSLRSQIASPGVFQRCPSVVFHRGVHSRAPFTSTLDPGFPSGEERQLLSVFRPHGFSPSRRVPPPSDSLTVLADRDPVLADRVRFLRTILTIVPMPRTCFSAFPTLGFTTFPQDHCNLGSSEPPSRSSCIPVMHSCPSKPFPRPQQRCPAKAVEASPPLHRGKTSPSASVAQRRFSSPDFHLQVFTAFLALSPLPAFRGWEVPFSSAAQPLSLKAFLRDRVRCPPRGCPLDRPVASMGLYDTTLSHLIPGFPERMCSRVIV